MYFENVKLYDTNKIIDFDKMYAHTKEGEIEPLIKHMDLFEKYFDKLITINQLSVVFIRFEKIFFKDNPSKAAISLWREMGYNSGYMHDVGKAIPDFQYIKMNNRYFKQSKYADSKHSAVSALVYLNEYYFKIIELGDEVTDDEKYMLAFFAFVNSYIISKHHSVMDEFNIKEVLIDKFEDYEGYKEFLNTIFVDFKLESKHVKGLFNGANEFIKNKEDLSEVYIYSKLLYSIIVASDFYATYEFKNDSEIIDFGTINNCEEIFAVYKNNPIYKNYIKHKLYLEGKEKKSPFKTDSINLLRTELMIESEYNLKKHSNSNIYYLEAPTGSGKTNTSINLALNVLSDNETINKIFYIFPFNNLVEQTKESLEKEFGDSLKWKIGVINSITPIEFNEVEKEEDGKIVYKGREIDYSKALIDRQFLHYPFVLTTHVSFFDIIFGTSRREAMSLCHLANSVVVIDEIQSYKNNIWKEIIFFLDKYAKLLNLKIIIMSATLPKLGEMIDSKRKEIISLIKYTDKYFLNKLFKDRVKLNYDLLDFDREEILEKLERKVIELSKEKDKSILIEFISKTKANEFFKLLNEKSEANEIKNKEILLITGDDNKYERKKIISKVKKEKNIILVATQVVEAGVDIDMNYGFKDISLFDSEEQFLGRINRSAMFGKNGVVYFFNLTGVRAIYRGDIRNNDKITLENNEMRKVLEEKDFSKYYKQVIEILNAKKTQKNDNSFSYFIKEKVNKLAYKDIKKHMKLIEDKFLRYTVFLNIFIDTESGKIRGEDVWEEYKELLNNKKMSYAERMVKLSKVQEELDLFTYEVKKEVSGYNDYVGGIFYFDDGEKYFTNGKFDSEKFTNDDFI